MHSRQIPAILSSKDVQLIEEIRESVRVNYWVGSHDPARTSSGSMLELWISDGLEWFFRRKFSVPKFAVLARSKQLILMPVTVKFRSDFFGLWSLKTFAVASRKRRPHFHVNKATKQWRIVENPYQKLEVPESGSTLHQLCSIQYPRFELQDIDFDLGCLTFRLLQINEESYRFSF